MVLEISSTLRARLLKEVEASPEAEICGLLFGTPERIEVIERCANVADDPSCTFEIDPRALLAAHRAMRWGGPRLIGYYHSHPNGLAEPSVHDRASATGDGMIWAILAGSGLTFWRATPPGSLDPVEWRLAADQP